jgi:hypothetical protein
MAKLRDINRQFANDPAYQAILSGRSNPYGYPTGPDGRVNRAVRAEAARQYIREKTGEAPIGAMNEEGEFYDPNASHWYSPQYIGPAAVALGTLGMGALTGGLSAASAAGSAGSSAGSGATGAGLTSAGLIPSSVPVSQAGLAAGTAALANGSMMPGITAAGGLAGAGSTALDLAKKGGGIADDVIDGVKTGMTASDWVKLALGGIGAIGGSMGSDPFQKKKGYKGATTNPETVMANNIANHGSIGDLLTKLRKPSMRSSIVAAPPGPVSIPGLGIQIGGGLGRDPALDDPSLVEGQGLASQWAGPAGTPQAKLRKV